MRSNHVLLPVLLSFVLGAQTPPTPPPAPEAPKTEPPAKPSPEPVLAPAPNPQEAPAPAAPETKPAEPGQPGEALAPAEAAKPVRAPAPAGKAILLFYRESRFVGGALRPSIYVDGVEVAYLSSGSYLKVAVTPGDHTIYADKKDDELTLPAEPDKTYYFRVGIRAGLFKGHGKVEPMSPEAGAKEFEAWKPKLTYTEKILKPELIVKD